MRQHTSAYVSIRQHTSAYASIRQHTSACQHTSAYVRIRPHTPVTPVTQRYPGCFVRPPAPPPSALASNAANLATAAPSPSCVSRLGVASASRGSSLAEAEGEAEGAAYEDAEEEAEEARVLAEAARSRALTLRLRGRSEKPSVLPIRSTGTQMEEAGSMMVRARPAYVSIRQHTSAYASRWRRQARRWCVRALHASAYVSIRQHMSAYAEHTLSIR